VTRRPRWLAAHLRRMIVAVAAATAVMAVPAGVAHAHNSLVSTDPAEGAVLTAAPAQVSFVFAKAVPLESATITFIDPTGVRTELPIAHGPSGETEVVASLAGLTVAGEASMRWRLVGDDGHVVSGRLAFTTPAAGGVVDAGGGSGLGGATTVPGGASNTTVDPAAVSSTVPTTGDGSGGSGAGDGAGTGDGDGADGGGADGSGADDAAGDGEPSNGALAWLARFGSYLAIIAVLAIALLEVWVWPGVAATALGRRLVQWGLVAVAVLGLVQLAVLASDISGNSVLAALGELRPALDTPVGQALVVRVVLAGVAAVLLAEPVVRVRPEVQVGPGAPAGPGVHAGSGVHAARGAHAGSGVHAGPGVHLGPGVHAGPVAHAGPGVDAGPGVHAAQGRWTALALLGLVMLGTWAWTGHSRTERWPWLGVPVDIVHHGAAALWLGGLAVLAGMALGGAGPLRPGAAESLRPGATGSLGSGATGSLGSGAAGSLGPIEVVGVMRRFSTTAMVAVIVIAVTGLVQTVRLHDDLGALLSGQHGRLVAVKAVAFVGMLAVAAGNRRRVAGLVDADVAGVGTAGAGAVGVGAAGAGAAGLGAAGVGAAGLGAAGVDPAGLDVAGAGAVGVGGRSTLAMLRRSMLIDVGVGVAVIAVTTSLVVSLR